MNFEFFTPVSEDLITEMSSNTQTLAASMKIHSEGNFPELEGVKIAVFGVREDRLDENRSGEPIDFEGIRRSFYSLYPGNWDLTLADLGDIQAGESVDDTYFAVKTVVEELVKKDIIPIILGGSQDLIYAQYRAYDNLDQMVNLVNIDSRFDLGNAEQPISNRSYMGKIVVTKPYNLFNYSNLGYQTYYNPQEEIELMDRLFFDAYRLGEISSNLSIVEPVMRDANLVGIDMGAVSAGALGNSYSTSPNGFDGKEICALARYAGISDKVSSFGIYEINNKINFLSCHMLIAQMLWYFAEGVNYRTNENSISAKQEFTKYQVPIEEEVLVFYKSPVSGRWWIEIPFVASSNNKLRRHTLLPCTHDDYLDACNQVLPERWYRAKRKNEI